MTTYPATITSDHPKVFASLEGETYAVHFPYSAEAVEYAKRELKAPKYDARSKTWHVKKRWHKSLPAVLVELATLAHAADTVQAGKDQAKAEKVAAEEEAGRAALAAMPAFSGSLQVTAKAKTVEIHTAYHSELVRIFKAAGGKWRETGKVWVLPISAGAEIAERREEIRVLHNAAVAASQAERSERQARRANRRLVRASSAPRVGEAIQTRDGWMVVESHGKTFTANEDTSSIGGPVGAEGQAVRYIYLRDATAAEAAEADGAETERKHKAEARKRQADAIATVAAGEIAPHTGQKPAGEVIWSDEQHAATGYRRWITHGADGYLYHLTYDGTDGGAWGEHNAGYNTRARRVPASDALVAAIKNGAAT